MLDEDRPTHFGGKVISSSPDARGNWGSQLCATSREGRCVLEWYGKTESPFASVHAEHAHGERFMLGSRTYLTYVERVDGEWGDDGFDEASLDALRALPAEALDNAARRFLDLPYVARWHTDAFAERTGFVQCRDGRVPRVRDCAAEVTADSVRVRWDELVWDLFRLEWIADGAHAAFAKDVRGRDLVTLRDCATVLSAIPVK